jgi:hypothetical protein
MMHDPVWILPRCGTYGCLIQINLAGSRCFLHNRLGQRALADLPGTIDHYYPRVRECIHRHGFRAAREERQFIDVHGSRIGANG